MNFHPGSGLAAAAASVILSPGVFSPVKLQDQVDSAGEVFELWVPFDTGGGTVRFVRWCEIQRMPKSSM